MVIDWKFILIKYLIKLIDLSFKYPVQLWEFKGEKYSRFQKRIFFLSVLKTLWQAQSKNVLGPLDSNCWKRNLNKNRQFFSGNGQVLQGPILWFVAAINNGFEIFVESHLKYIHSSKFEKWILGNFHKWRPTFFNQFWPTYSVVSIKKYRM